MEVVLRPVVVVAADADVEKAERLHDKAHAQCFIAQCFIAQCFIAQCFIAQCFIARLVAFPVRNEPTIRLAPAMLDE